MNVLQQHWKGMLAFIGTLCTAFGTAATDGGITLSETLLAVGGTLAATGLVIVGPKNAEPNQ